MPNNVRRAVVLMMLAAGLVMLAGCASPGEAQLKDAYAAYNRQDYQGAYRLTARLATTGDAVGEEAAYVAGMSAYRLNNATAAEPYLLKASRSTDSKLSGEALATIGLIEAAEGHFGRAAASLEAAADRLTGQDRANAHYYAALSQQKLGQWSKAAANLTLAHRLSKEPAFIARVEEAGRVVGWAVQVGAFADAANAQRAAQALAGRAAALSAAAPRMVPSVDAQGQNLTLVQIGQYRDYVAADRLRLQLGQPSAIIVPITR